VGSLRRALEGCGGVIAVIALAVVGALIGREIGRSHGARRADELTWQLADLLGQGRR